MASGGRVSTVMASSSCPACEQTVFTMVGHGQVLEVLTKNGSFLNQSYSVARCRNCHLFYKMQRPSTKELQSYYKNELDYRGLEIDGLFPTERIVLRMLKREKSRLKVLDFGCSSGRLLSKLVQKHDCFGVEPNVAAAQEARKKGITVLAFEELKEQRQQFDIIVLADVYEHLERPAATLKMLIEHLANDGCLIIVTGLAEGMAGDIARSWYLQTFGHLLLISQKHIKWLGDTLKLKIVSIARTSHYDSNTVSRLSQRMRHWLHPHVYPRVTLVGWLFLKLNVGLKVHGASMRPHLTLAKDHVVVCYKKMSNCKG